MPNEFFARFRRGLVREFKEWKERGEFLPILRQCQPSHPYLEGASLESESVNPERIDTIVPAAIYQQNKPARRVGEVVSNRFLRSVTGEDRLLLPSQKVSLLTRTMRTVLHWRNRAGPVEADPTRKLGWRDTEFAVYRECVACLTFVRRDPKGAVVVLQDRFVAIVDTSSFYQEVFAVLQWERTVATD